MSLPHLLMVVVDDEKEMANPHRKYLQRSGFNSNTYFTDSLFTFNYHKKDIRLHTIITGLQVFCLYDIKRFGKKIERKSALQKVNHLINIQCSKMMDC
jgi:hypothetical protein